MLETMWAARAECSTLLANLHEREFKVVEAEAEFLSTYYELSGEPTAPQVSVAPDDPQRRYRWAIEAQQAWDDYYEALYAYRSRLLRVLQDRDSACSLFLTRLRAESGASSVQAIELSDDLYLVPHSAQKNVVETIYSTLLSRHINGFFQGSTRVGPECVLYQPETRMLVVDYPLPSPKALSRMSAFVRDVRIEKRTSEVIVKECSETESRRIYEDVLYKLTLRSLYILFAADTIGALQSVVFNGWVEMTDKSTGNPCRSCILSVQASRSEYMKLNLSAVDPKMCFRHLKGVCCADLHSLTPVAPIAAIDREDKRFVDGRPVVHAVGESTNLAMMDWEDFEHLVRELFEKEFSQNGGQVHVTRASRDGGIDAVAFDPDPLRGGKIVIQAKRYTNTVGVSAVRDLYGTLINEGAVKGILVTTSDYGSDAYEFAKGKPLTLLNGANLLHLLAKHGHSARIDLREAKAQDAVAKNLTQQELI